MDWTVQVSLIDASSSSNELMVQVLSERRFRRTNLANDTCLWEPKLLLLLRFDNRAAGACIASSPESDLEAFSHNPAHGSFAPLAFQPSAMTNCANNRFLSTPALSFKDVPPQPNSPPDNVLHPDRLAKASLGSKRRGCHPASDSRSNSELAVRRPRKDTERTVPSPSPGRHESVHSHHVNGSSSPPRIDGFRTGTPEPSPQRQSFFRSYGSIFPNSLAYIIPSTRRSSPWRPNAVMSTTGGERHSVLWIFKGRRNAPDTTRRASFAPIPKSDKRFARQYRCGPPPEFPMASPRSGIVHHLSGPDRHAHTRTLLRRSRSVSCAPKRDPANQLPCALRTAPHGTTGSGHDGALTLFGAPFQGTWARSVAEDSAPDYNSTAEDV
ncbi:hypothetical protein Bca101_051370 [Brassica carinata]